MKHIFIISLIFLQLLPLSVAGQSLTNSKRRHINSKVLTLIEDYERYATLYDEESEYYFSSLFLNETSTVHNDMIASDSYRTQIAVADYIRLLRGNSVNTNVSILDVKKGEMIYAEGVWDIPVYFRKSFSYIDGNGYLFSVKDWHKTDFDMTMHIIYDEETDACHIKSITGKLDSDKDFNKWRFLIVNEAQDQDERYMNYFNSLKVNGKPIEYNEFGQAIITSGMAYVDDMDVVVDTVLMSKGFNYDVVSYTFNPRKARIKLRYGYSPESYNVKGSPQEMETDSDAMELGFDFGFAFPVGQNSKMGLYLGVGAMISNLDFRITTPFSYTYTSSSLGTGKIWEKVNTNYAINSADETVSYTDLFVPLYFELEHRLGGYLLLSWSLGAKAYYNFQTNVGESRVSFSADSEPKTLTKTFSAAYYQKYPLDYSAFANIGLDVNLLKRKMYFMVRVGYEYGFTPTFKSSAASYYKSHTNYPSFPVVNGGNNNHILVHPMINGLEINRQGLWISGGLKFKL